MGEPRRDQEETRADRARARGRTAGPPGYVDLLGVRELKQNASRLLERVKAGERLEVTERGRPIALLTPLEDEDEYGRLVEAGEILPDTQDLLVGAALRVGDGARLSDDLAALRDEDWR